MKFWSASEHYLKKPHEAAIYVTRHTFGAVMPMHRHQYAYASLVLDGSYLEYGVDGRFLVNAGDLIVHPPHHAHGDAFVNSAARVLGIALEQTDLPGAAYGISIPHATQLADAIFQRPECAAELIRHELAGATIRLDNIEPPSRIADAAAVWRSAERLNVAEAASKAGVSGAYFCRLFKRYFGVPPTVYRSEHRFRCAARNIQGGRSLAETAAEFGYADQSHMTRDFQSRAFAPPSFFAKNM